MPACLLRPPAGLVVVLLLLLLGPVLVPLTGPLAPLAPIARAQMAVPPLQGRVNDLTATLAPQQREALERKLAQFEQRKGSQIVILMLPSTQPEPIETFSIRVAEAWKIGRGRPSSATTANAIDDGVLIVVAKDDRRMRIEVGYGLEGAIPDAIAKRVISENMTPRFRQNDFAGGLDAAVQALIARIDTEALPAPPQGQAGPSSASATNMSQDGLLSALLPVILVAFFIGLVASQILGRFLGASLGAGIGVYAGASVITSWIWLAPVALILFVLILLMGGARRRGVRSVGGRRGSAPWVIPGGGLGGGWGDSGGGGGFSGGGGGFGGGGASGDW